MKTRKKLFAVLLTLVMVTGVLPVSAFAEGDGPAAGTEFAAEDPDNNEEDTTEETGAPSDPGELPDEDRDEEPGSHSEDTPEEDQDKEQGGIGDDLPDKDEGKEQEGNGGDRKVEAEPDPDDEADKPPTPEPAMIVVPEPTQTLTSEQDKATAKKAAPALKDAGRTATIPDESTSGLADEKLYAIFDSEGGSLTFKRAAGTYTDGQEVDTKTYYTGAEDIEYTAGNRPSWLAKANHIKKVDFQTTVVPKSCICWFDRCRNLEEVQNAHNLDVSGVTSTRLMFNGCLKLESIDVSKWNTSKVTDMGSMFEGCQSLKSLDVSGWNTSMVADMDGMFRGCLSLSDLDVSKWNTSKVEDMGGMFASCSSLASLDVSGWDTSKVTDIAGMFGSCSSLASLDVSGWKTSEVTGMGSMFYFCSSLSSLNVSGWDTSKVLSMASMFNKCSNLASLDVSGWNTSKVIMMSDMFCGCSKLDFLDLSGWNTSNAENMQNMFKDCSSLSAVRLGDNFSFRTRIPNPDSYAVLPDAPESLECGGRWINESVTGASGVTPAELTDKYLKPDVPGRQTSGTYVWEGTQKVAVFDSTYSSLTFKREAGTYTDGQEVDTKTYYTGFEDKDYSENMRPPWLIHWSDIEKVDFRTTVVPRTFAFWFFDCQNLLEVSGTGKLNFSDVATLDHMFYNCKSLVSLDVSLWNTSRVTDMSCMFYGCSSLASLDVSSWNTSKVESMGGMFGSCDELASLDVSGWNTSKVEKSMGDMFSGCHKLVSLDLSGWDTAKVELMAVMFTGCSSLSSIRLGENFSFKGAAGDPSKYAVLPDAPADIGHGGRWINVTEAGATGVTPADLRDNYPDATDPGFAPGTYTWETCRFTLEQTDAVQETCTTAGNSAYWTCTVCRKYYSDDAGESEIEEDSWVIPATGHSMTHHDAVAPTCTEDGAVEYWACGNCNKNFSDEQGNNGLDSIIDPKTGHDYGEWEKLDDAQHQRVCSHDNSHVEKEDHKWDKGKSQTKDGKPVTLFTCTVCKATKEVENESKTYKLTSGANGSWTKGSTTSLSFTFKNNGDDSETFDHFSGIKVDGKVVPEKDASGKANWTAKSGSVIIELQPSYLETLSVGKHKLTASFDDGDDVTTEFTVKAKAATPAKKATVSGKTTSGKAVAAKTGDESNVPLWICLTAVATGALLFIGNKRRRAG